VAFHLGHSSKRKIPDNYPSLVQNVHLSIHFFRCKDCFSIYRIYKMLYASPRLILKLIPLELILFLESLHHLFRETLSLGFLNLVFLIWKLAFLDCNQMLSDEHIYYLILSKYYLFVLWNSCVKVLIYCSKIQHLIH
jgi:hypothetical protein